MRLATGSTILQSFKAPISHNGLITSAPISTSNRVKTLIRAWPTIDREICKSDIRDKCVEWINRDLADVIKYINDAKEAIILEYVNEEAPQYRLLMRRRAEFLEDKIPASPSKPEIDTALHREMFQQEQRLRHEGARMIKEAEKLDDYEDYQARLSEFVERQNELGVSALAQYVSHRKIILDFLERAISKATSTDKYPLERAVHHLYFRFVQRLIHTLYSQQNFWIIDERVTYHSFLSSDHALASLHPQLESDSLKRPDLFRFDRKIASRRASSQSAQFQLSSSNDHSAMTTRPTRTPSGKCTRWCVKLGQVHLRIITAGRFRYRTRKCQHSVISFATSLVH